jgi:hypothetical protein
MKFIVRAIVYGVQMLNFVAPTVTAIFIYMIYRLLKNAIRGKGNLTRRIKDAIEAFRKSPS